MTTLLPESLQPCDTEVDDRPGDYFVSCRRDDGWVSLVAGPWLTHREALDNVRQISRMASDMDVRSCWYAWGTCRAELRSEFVSVFDKQGISYREGDNADH